MGIRISANMGPAFCQNRVPIFLQIGPGNGPIPVKSGSVFAGNRIPFLVETGTRIWPEWVLILLKVGAALDPFGSNFGFHFGQNRSQF